MMAGPGEFLAAYGLLAIFLVMLVKEFGVPVPVPSDLILITAGIQAAAGAYSVPALLLAVGVATLVGSTAQFLLARSAGRQFVYRTGRLVGLTPARLDQAGAMLERRGPLAIFVGLNIPGARAGIVAAAGLAGVTYRAFAPAMLGGSMAFYGWHIALGYLVGPSATTLLEGLHLPLGPVVLALVLLGLIGWLALRGRRRARAPEEATVDRLHSWTEAACPACLALTLLQRQGEPNGAAR